MNPRLFANSKINLASTPLILALVISFVPLSALAQGASTKSAQTNAGDASANNNSTKQQSADGKDALDDKSAQVIKRAVEALGGNAYLNVSTMTGRGLYTPFRDKVSGVPSMFVDYIAYPDKERTEFKAASGRTVQTNTGNKGWVYDGAAKTLKDMTSAQVEEFRSAMRTSFETLLRGVWRKENAKVSYVGRREAGLAKRNETLRVTYADGFAVEFEFSASDGLPAKAIYKKKNEDGDEVLEEDRLAQFINVQGIATPFVIDHYSAAAQTSRINYQSIEFNRPLPDSLFERPANAKAVK